MGEGELAYKRYIEGDDSSFEKVVRFYRADITAYALSIVRDRFAAEDVVADVFCYIVIHKRRYNFSVPLKYYLLMICKSRAIDYLRKEKKYTELDESFPDSSGDKVTEKILQDERKSALYRAIGGLSPEMRSAIYLVYFEEMSYEDVAKTMKITKKKVDNLLYFAKQKLKKELGAL